VRILTVVGARPQFIKAAPLSDAIRARHTEILVHTGQHYDEEMSDIFFQQLGIPAPDVNLGVGSSTHAEQLAAMLPPLERLAQKQSPDWVVVIGDTNSTLAGALAAAKLHIPIAHVEAGLRSYNRTMPEEINRVLTDHVSDLLFAPTQVALDNLAKEGITTGVVMTGDIMVDAVLRTIKTARQQSTILNRLKLSSGGYIAATIHRPANTDDSTVLRTIIEMFDALPLPVIFPAHPRTLKVMQTAGITPGVRVQVIAPLGYMDMLMLLDEAAVLITDSGGLQKEAYVLHTPCVTVRSETEWVETVQSGWNRLAAPDDIFAAVDTALKPPPNEHPDFYGSGDAAMRMVAAMNGALKTRELEDSRKSGVK
jgi:UDP-GlcNAc3NAcA epimerase